MGVAGTPPSTGQAAASRSSKPTRSHTRASFAPIPSARIFTRRGRTSSVEYVSEALEENPESNSYGVARLPYTTRFAKRRARARTGWNAIATTAAAIADRTGLPRSPTAVPIPTTSAMYTAVMNAASTANTTVLPITTSISYKRYFRTAIPIDA